MELRVTCVLLQIIEKLRIFEAISKHVLWNIKRLYCEEIYL